MQRVPTASQKESGNQQWNMRKRIAIAAEALTSVSDVEIPNILKSDVQRKIIGKMRACSV